jgi:hypothetical protein
MGRLALANHGDESHPSLGAPVQIDFAVTLRTRLITFACLGL